MSPLEYWRPHRRRLESLLHDLLDPRHFPDTHLTSVMRYAVLDGGKRLRPMLAWATAEALGTPAESADIPACALELVHAYSLVHDDLPAMDDDRLRRGKPTCHIRFGEASAILAGDALQSLAFELLVDSPRLPVGTRARLAMVGELARAAGPRGMVAGQSLDIQAEGLPMGDTALVTMHRLKTGALIRASVLLGALCRLSVSETELVQLGRFADCIGLAFQIRDDILDVVSDTATLGKEQGRDISLNKPTYVSMLGMEGAEARCAALIDEALTVIDALGPASGSLAELTRYIGTREY